MCDFAADTQFPIKAPPQRVDFLMPLAAALGDISLSFLVC